MTEEEEFQARYQRESIKELKAANKRLQDVVNSLVGNVTAGQPLAPVVVNAPVSRKSMPQEWSLQITDREGGMMKTVTAYCDGKQAYTFDIERYRDGYIKQILTVPVRSN